VVPSLKDEVRDAIHPLCYTCAVRAAEEAGMRDFVVAGSSGGPLERCTPPGRE